MTYPLHGLVPLGGNRLSEGEYHDSLLALQSLENTRALYYALSGEETDGTPAAPAGGHAHDTGSTELSWLQVGSWQLYTHQRTAYGARIVDETTETPVALLAFVLPPGSTTVTPRANVRVPNGTTLTLEFDFFEPGNLNAAPDASATLTKAGLWEVTGSKTKWFDGADEDLSGLGNTDSRRIVYLLVSASVDTGTADLAGVALGLTDESSAPASVALDESLALAHTDLAPDDLAALFVDNPKRLRDLIYGVTYPHPRHSRPHDHGEGRGEPLGRHLLSLTYGPHVPEGDGSTAGGDIGIPILEPDTGVDFEARPKVIAQQGLFVPGGVDEIKFRIATYLPGGGTREVDLLVEVRPLSDVGYGPGDNLGITGTLGYSASGSNNFQEGTTTIDLSSLGDIHRDRVFDLVVWQASNPPAASTYRLCGLLAYAGDAPATLPELATHQPAEAIAYSKILEGQEVSTLLAAKIHRALNQVTYEALGGVPGLETDLATTDTTDPWLRQLSETHKHRGSYDDDSGNKVDDGAPVRLPLWAQAYTANLAADDGDLEGAAAIADPVLGQRLGTYFVGRCPIPKGLRAVEIYALIQPGITNLESRLLFLADVDRTAIDGSGGIHVAARSGPFVYQATSAGADIVLQVLPQNGVAWQDNATRLSVGQSLWTTDALKSVADLPSAVSVTNCPRWTQAIRVEIEPAPGASDGYAYDVDLKVAFILQFGPPADYEDDTTWATSARVLSILCVPAADEPTPTPAARSTTRDRGAVESPSLPSGSGAPTTAQYLVGAADGTLSAERVVTDTATVAWDLGTATQAKANVPDDSITYAKLQNLATDRLLGRDTAGSGSAEELTVGGGLEFTGSAGIQRSALTGDVTASAGSNSTTIANDAVTDAKLRDSGACSVIGRSANSSGNPGDISAASNGTVLCRTGDALSFVAISTLGALQVYMFGASSINTGQNTKSYLNQEHGTAAASTSAPAFRRRYFNRSATIQNLRVDMTGTVSQDVDVILEKNGSDTAMVATVTSGNTSASYSSSTVSVSATDYVNIYVSPRNGNLASGVVGFNVTFEVVY